MLKESTISSECALIALANDVKTKLDSGKLKFDDPELLKCPSGSEELAEWGQTQFAWRVTTLRPRHCLRAKAK